MVRWLCCIVVARRLKVILATAHGIALQLALPSCTALRSIALWITLDPPGGSTACQQWAASLALLQQIPTTHIERIGIGIVVDGEGFGESALMQVKQMRWGNLLGSLGRFQGLRRLEVMVVEEEELVGDDIWAVLYGQLRGVTFLGNGTRLVRTPARML